MKELLTPLSKWCWHPELNAGTACFILFRRVFKLEKSELINLAVSADNRYNLYLDGKLLGRGPCRGDLENYKYEYYSINIESGNHILAAEVLVYSLGFRNEEGPWSEIHTGGGFIIAGGSSQESLATPNGWRCIQDFSRSHRKWSKAWDIHAAIPAPPMEEIDFSKALHAWFDIRFDDSNWHTPKNIGSPCFKEACEDDPSVRWWLTERKIPQMQTESTAISAIIDTDISSLVLRNGRLSGKIAAGTHKLLLDIGRNQTSMIHVSGHGGSGKCRIAYAESLFLNGKRGFRGVVAGGSIGEKGMSDLLSFGKNEWCFDSFWYRSGRFIEMEFNLSEALELDNMHLEFISYPFEMKAKFQNNNEGKFNLKQIYDVAWHTARCCAHEHYEDCPYWEQLQYVGDTRIQALISYAATGDGRLGRQAVEHFDQSRLPCGLTQSRYPSNYTQIIPEFSLFWILMIEDYYDYFGDIGIIREHITGIHSVMKYFESKRNEKTKLIGDVGYWNITDWATQWPGGKSDRGTHKPETIINLIYAECCRAAARFCRVLSKIDEAVIFENQRESTINAVNTYCFSETLGIYRDVPDEEWYSQHVNAWAILSGAAKKENQEHIIHEIMHNPNMAQCTLYFSFYLLELMRITEKDSEFEKLLHKWQDMLDLGFTSFPEIPAIYARSDCHAWSSAPVYEIIRYYFGVSPLEPGFKTICIAPRTGSIRSFSGQVPAGEGKIIYIEWENNKEVFSLRVETEMFTHARIVLPGMAAKEIDLEPGKTYRLTGILKRQ